MLSDRSAARTAGALACNVRRSPAVARHKLERPNLVDDSHALGAGVVRQRGEQHLAEAAAERLQIGPEPGQRRS
ncbi:MAG: hypothetical protein ABW003_27020 [Microvirga sp.]